MEKSEGKIVSTSNGKDKTYKYIVNKICLMYQYRKR